MFFMMSLAAMVSCGLQEIGGHSKDDKEDVWIGPGTGIVNGGTEGPVRSVWYMTGFDYPEDYDWRSDPVAGEVKCSLVVFANGIPMMKVPVGHEYEVSSDPDMHRMVGSDLYTDYSTDSLTVIRKNGQRMFSYPGREMIVGMYVDGEDVYTLGQSRSGKGFTYRRNGELLMGRSNGTLFDTFFKTDAGCAFVFYESVMSESETLERYFICIEGVVSQIAVREDITKVWDVLYKDGRLFYIATIVGFKQPVLVSEDSMHSLVLGKQTVMRTCRFVPSASGVAVDCVAQHITAGTYTGGFWRDGKIESTFPTGFLPIYSCAWEDGICCILEGVTTGRQKIFRTGEIYEMPEGYAVMGTCPMAVADGILYVGLTPSEGKEPQVWKDGELQPVKLNGYISSISVP